jgi:cytoskeletal protein CcmA (bactofilin family)
MFNNGKSTTSGPDGDSSRNHISQGTVISGDIETQGDIRVDGRLSGSLVCKGKLVLGETGRIDGDVECVNANISGTLKATIKVKELLSLQGTAKVLGDIETDKLDVVSGATFTGQCSMGAVIKEMKSSQKEKEQKSA